MDLSSYLGKAMLGAAVAPRHLGERHHLSRQNWQKDGVFVLTKMETKQ
jgi:hypothetical protein